MLDRELAEGEREQEDLGEGQRCKEDFFEDAQAQDREEGTGSETKGTGQEIGRQGRQEGREAVAAMTARSQYLEPHTDALHKRRGTDLSEVPGSIPLDRRVSVSDSILFAATPGDGP